MPSLWGYGQCQGDVQCFWHLTSWKCLKKSGIRDVFHIWHHISNFYDFFKITGSTQMKIHLDIYNLFFSNRTITWLKITVNIRGGSVYQISVAYSMLCFFHLRAHKMKQKIKRQNNKSSTEIMQGLWFCSMWFCFILKSLRLNILERIDPRRLVHFSVLLSFFVIENSRI